MNWITFLPKKINLYKFELNAIRYGVFRIPPERFLKKMAFGDRIHMVKQDEDNHLISTYIGYFKLEYLLTNRQKLFSKIKYLHTLYVEEYGGIKINTQEFTFTTVSNFKVKEISLQNLIAKAESVGCCIFGIGGSYYPRDKIKTTFKPTKAAYLPFNSRKFFEEQIARFTLKETRKIKLEDYLSRYKRNDVERLNGNVVIIKSFEKVLIIVTVLIAFHGFK